MKLKAPAKYFHGFTLVELILGLVIAAIIAVSIYNMFWSAMKLDDKMRRVHDNYMELLMADLVLTHDLENAVSIDFSSGYPDAKIFDGQKTDFSFITQTPTGLKRIRYYSGLLDHGGTARSMIGRVVNESGNRSDYTKGSLPVEFLLRQESSLADWLNETTTQTTTQMIATGLKSSSFNCQYAPQSKDLHSGGSKAIQFQDTWDDKYLPMEVSCSFVLFDPKNPDAGLMFKRDFLLAPLANDHNEQ